MTEDRIARMVNATMVSVIALCFVVFGVWNAMTSFAAVRQIYSQLALHEQIAVSRFISAVGLLLAGLTCLGGVAKRRTVGTRRFPNANADH